MSENYEFIENIGSGMYGEVYKALNKSENKYYAIKRLNFKDISDKEKNSINKEVSILQKLNHPNILSYKDSFIDRDNYYSIVTNFCEGGDIYKQIQNHKQKNEYFSEEQILKWMIQLLLGLSYIHKKKIIHRDIKPQNIFIINKYLICIGDFGIAKIINQTQTQTIGTSIVGTPLYMSPESFNGPKSNNFPTDIWSTGCCLYELCNLNHAFGGDSWNAVFNKVREGKRAPINKKYSSDLRNIIDSMLDIHPGRRPTIYQLIENSFLKPKVRNFILGFIRDFKKYDSNEESVEVLKVQAEEFKISLIENISREINEFSSIEKEKRLIEKKKKVLQRIEELNRKKNNQIKNNIRDFSNPTSMEKDEKFKKYSVNKNKKKLKNDFSENHKNNKHEEYMSNDSKKRYNLKDGNRNSRKSNFSNNRKKPTNRPLTTKNFGEKIKDNKNNISVINKKDKNNDIRDIKNINNMKNNVNILNKSKENNNNNLEFKNNDEVNPNEKGMNNKQIILNERINYFKKKCNDSLGEKIFLDAYNYLSKVKKNKNMNVNNLEIRENLMNMFGRDNIGFWQLIEQILILEDILNDK
jgi:serine/threonine protein kinase